MKFFENVPSIRRKIETMNEVGLSYIRLGQPSTELSGGEAQRIKLAAELSKRSTGKTVYILDEPIAGVDPAARDYILKTIIQDYSEDASILLSTHLIADVEQLLDDVIFLKDGQIILSSSVEEIRDTRHQSVDSYFREVFSCSQN